MTTIASDVPSDEKGNGRGESIAQRWEVRAFPLFQYQVVRKEPMLQRTCPSAIGMGGVSPGPVSGKRLGAPAQLGAPGASEAVLRGQTRFRGVWVELSPACACL